MGIGQDLRDEAIRSEFNDAMAKTTEKAWDYIIAAAMLSLVSATFFMAALEQPRILGIIGLMITAVAGSFYGVRAYLRRRVRIRYATRMMLE